MIDNVKVKSQIDLRKLAQKRGQSIKDFSESCGVSPQSMAQYMRGALSETTIYKIAQALDIDPRDMFFPTEDDEQTTPTETEEQTAEVQETEPVQTMAFCPHCGAKVRVGVVLLAD